MNLENSNRLSWKDGDSRASGDNFTISSAQIALLALSPLVLLDGSATTAPSLTNENLRSGFVRQQTNVQQNTLGIDSQESIKRFEIGEQLRRYADLHDDWDGYGGHAPTRQDIENAVWFIPHIPKGALFSAQLMVAGDGDVGFFWKQKDRYLEVGFLDGTISFYGETPDGEEISGGENFNGAAFPGALADFMNSFLSG